MSIFFCIDLFFLLNKLKEIVEYNETAAAVVENRDVMHDSWIGNSSGRDDDWRPRLPAGQNFHSAPLSLILPLNTFSYRKKSNKIKTKNIINHLLFSSPVPNNTVTKQLWPAGKHHFLHSSRKLRCFFQSHRSYRRNVFGFFCIPFSEFCCYCGKFLLTKHAWNKVCICELFAFPM